MNTIEQSKVEIINGKKYYALPEHSYVSYLYQKEGDGVYFNHSYIRLPVEGDTTVYEDRYVTHVHMRDDVYISTYPDGSVMISYRYGDPFLNVNVHLAEQRRREREKELFFELLREDGLELDEKKVSVQFKDGKIEIKHLDSGHTTFFFGPFSAYGYIADNGLYKDELEEKKHPQNTHKNMKKLEKI